jgi:hypothetical protein
MLDFPGYDYYWPMTDDDLLDQEAGLEFLKALSAVRPAVAVCEFRQGEDLTHGTFFKPGVAVLTGPRLDLEPVIRFGKGTNMVFRAPSPQLLDTWARNFRGCMYEDKALALLALSFDEDASLLVFPELTLTADRDFGHLRYSMRAFANLQRVATLVGKINRDANLANFWSETKFHGEWWWWLRGLIHHFEPRGRFRYQRSVLLRELIFPLLWLANHLTPWRSNLWVSWITWRRYPATVAAPGDLIVSLASEQSLGHAEEGARIALHRLSLWR